MKYIEAFSKRIPFSYKHLILLVVLIMIGVILFPAFRSEEPASPHKPIFDHKLHSILIELRQELEWPGIDVETAAKNLKTPAAALEFVRNETLLIDYPGELADPVAVLRTRTANIQDRTRLLDALLREMGYTTRLRQYSSRSPIPAADFSGDCKNKQQANLAPLVEYLNLDLSTVEPDFDTIAQSFAAQITPLNKRVEDALETLNVLTPELFNGPPPKPLYQQRTMWNWVEYRLNDQEAWQRADPSFKNSLPKHQTKDYTSSPEPTNISIRGIRSDGRQVELMNWTGTAIGRDLELLFLPADHSPSALLSIKDPNKIWSWVPVLQLGQTTKRGKPFTPAGAILSDFRGTPASSLDENNNLRIHAPPVLQLQPASATSEEGKRVRLRMNVTTEEQPYWHAGHFSITDNGLPVENLRIDSVRTSPRPIILVLDTSGSMNDESRSTIATEATIQLIKMLPDSQKVALIKHGYSQVSIPQPLAPKSEGRVINAVQNLYFGGEQRILDAINTSLEMSEDPAYIVFLTDGVDTEATKSGYAQKLSATLEALRKSRSLVIPVGIGEADRNQLLQIAEASGSKYIAVDNIKDLPSLYEELGAALSGSIELSYTIPEVAEIGSQRVIDVSLDGFDGNVGTTYTVKEDKALGLVAIEMSINGPLTMSVTRTVADFSAGYDGWSMISRTAVWITPSLYPQHIVESRRVDSWIEALLMMNFANGGEVDRKQLARSISFEHAKTVNDMRIIHTALTGQSHFPVGPMIFISTTSLGLKGEDLVRTKRLDWASGYDWPKANDRRTLAKSFLSLLEAEGFLYGSKSVNAKLLDKADSLQVIRAQKDGSKTIPPSLRKAQNNKEKILIASTKTPNEAWLLNLNTGAVYGYIANGHELDKGVSLQEVAGKFHKIRSILRLYSHLGGGDLSGTFNPAGGVFSALSSFFDQEVQLYCYSTIMMNQVAAAIEEGDADFDAEEAQKKATKLCDLEFDPNEFARAVMQQSTAGFIHGSLQNAVAAKLSSKLGHNLGITSGSFADGIMSGIVSTTVSATDPTRKHFDSLLKPLGRIGPPTGLSSPSIIRQIEYRIANPES